jgi:hypothetical protein
LVVAIVVYVGALRASAVWLERRGRTPCPRSIIRVRNRRTLGSIEI